MDELVEKGAYGRAWIGFVILVMFGVITPFLLMALGIWLGFKVTW